MTQARKPSPALPEPASGPDFQTLFQGLPGLYLVFDTALVAVAVSDAYLAAVGPAGLQREQLLGRSLVEVFPQADDLPGEPSGETVLASAQRVLKTGEPEALPLLQRD